MALLLETGAQTDIGLVRRKNQDSFGIDESFGLFVLCDGMGGAAGGEVASQLAVETFLDIARQELSFAGSEPMERSCRALKRATAAANRAVVEHARREPGLRGMGSTLVAMRLEPGRATIVHVGDSRAFRIREGVAEQLTEDHSFIAEQLRLGLMTPEAAARSPLQSVITRAIGADLDVLPELQQVEVAAGDTLLLSSDGLTRHVDEAEIAMLLTAAATAAQGCEALIALAKRRGGSDNITCVVARVLNDTASTHSQPANH